MPQQYTEEELESAYVAINDGKIDTKQLTDDAISQLTKYIGKRNMPVFAKGNAEASAYLNRNNGTGGVANATPSVRKNADMQLQDEIQSRSNVPPRTSTPNQQSISNPKPNYDLKQKMQDDYIVSGLMRFGPVAREQMKNGYVNPTQPYFQQPPVQAKAKGKTYTEEEINAPVRKWRADVKREQKQNLITDLAQKTLAEKVNDEEYAKNNPILGNLAIFEKKTGMAARSALSGDMSTYGLPVSPQYQTDRNKVEELAKKSLITEDQKNELLNAINDELQNDMQNITGVYVDWQKVKDDVKLSPAEQINIQKDVYGSNLGAELLGTAASFAGPSGISKFAGASNLLAKSLQGASGKTGFLANKIASMLSKSPKALQAAVNEVIPGAFFGGSAPLLRGEDPFTNPGDFLKEAGMGAAFGAGFGAAGSVIGSGISKLISKLTKKQQEQIIQLTLPPGQKFEELPAPSGERPFAQTNDNFQPIEPNKRSSATKTPDIIQQKGNPILEYIANELRKPLGLPEGILPKQSRVKLVSRAKEVQQYYENKWNDFVTYVNKKYESKGRFPTQEEVVSEWSQVAERNDPNIFTVLELAFPDKKPLSSQAKDVVSRFGDDVIAKAKERQRMRDIAGLPPILKSQKPAQPEGNPLQFKKEVFAFANGRLPKKVPTNQSNIPIKTEVNNVPNNDVTVSIPSPTKFQAPQAEVPQMIKSQDRINLENKVLRYFPNEDVSKLSQKDLEDLGYEIDKQTSGVKTYQFDNQSKLANSPIDNLPKATTNEFNTLDFPKNENIQRVNDKMNLNMKEQNQQNNSNTPAPNNQNPSQSELIMQEDLLRKIKRDLNVTIKTGFVRDMGKGVRGFFHNLTHVIRTKKHNQFDTIAHEVGHNLDRRYGLRNDPNLDTKELIAFSRKYRPNHLNNYDKGQWIAESIAEYFRAFMLDPKYARDNAQNFTQLLDSKISKQDWKGLYSVADDMQKYYRQSPFDLAKSHVQMENPDDVIEWMSKFEKFYTGAVDQYYPTAKAEIQASNGTFQQEGGNLSAYLKSEGMLPAEISPYKLMRLSEGLPDIIKLFLDQKMKPILKLAKKQNVSLHDLATYAALRHSATERRGLESGFDPASFSALNDPKIATPMMKKLHQMMLDANDELLKIAEEAGLLSKETVDKWRNESPEYVPLRRYIEENSTGSQSYESSKHGNFANMIRPSSFKERKGGTLTIMNPIQNMIENAAMIIDASVKNKVKLALADLSKFEGNAGLVENISDKSRSPKLINGEQTAILTANPANNEMMVMRNGKPEVYQLHPALFESLQGMTPANSSFWMRIFQISARMFSGAKTLTPDFWIKQLFTDEYHPLQVVHNIKYKPFVDMVRGVSSLVMDKQLVERFIKSGGSYGGYYARGPKDIQRVLDGYRNDVSPLKKARKYIRLTPDGLLDILSYVPDKMFDVFGYVPNKIDEARRISIFKKLADKGYSDKEAAFIARDLMDFKRRGGGKDLKFATDTTSFLNANIQGKDKNIRGFMQNPAKFLAKGIIFTSIPTVGIYYWNKNMATEKQKQIINEAPAWKKYGFYQIAIPGTDMVGILPKPFDVSWFFSNILEDVLRYADKNNPSSVSEYLNENSKGAIPQIGNAMQPILDVIYNENSFTGAPIVPRGLENIEPRSQYDAYSTKTSKKIGEFLNVSPKKFDYLTDSYLGNFGKLPKRIIDDTILKDAYPTEPQAPKDSYAKQFLYGRFFANPNQQSDVINKFYEAFDKYEKLGLEAKKKGEIGDKEAYGRYKILLNAKMNAMDIFQSQKENVLNDITLTDDEKRKKIEELNQYRKNVAQIALDKINKQEGNQ